MYEHLIGRNTAKDEDRWINKWQKIEIDENCNIAEWTELCVPHPTWLKGGGEYYKFIYHVAKKARLFSRTHKLHPWRIHTLESLRTESEQAGRGSPQDLTAGSSWGCFESVERGASRRKVICGTSTLMLLATTDNCSRGAQVTVEVDHSLTTHWPLASVA